MMYYGFIGVVIVIDWICQTVYVSYDHKELCVLYSHYMIQSPVGKMQEMIL